MPEGRMLKKVISDSKSLGNLSSDSARLLYTWLIPFLDVEGRHSADPEIIKGHIFPKVKSMTISKIAGLLEDLSKGNLIFLYKANGEICLQFVKFHEHQKLHLDRERPSKIPPPLDLVQSTQESSCLIKDKVNKDNLNKSNGQAQNEFDQFWESYPNKEAKDVALEAFKALRKKESLETIAKAFNGYMDFLKHERVKNNFDRRPMNAATFLRKNRWKDFIDFKYEAPL